MATRLTKETICKIEAAIDRIQAESGWGEVAVSIVRGKVVGLKVLESVPIENTDAK